MGIRFAFPDDLRAIYETFGIDVGATNGTSEWTLPMPARYVVDASGVIQDAHIDPDYTARPEPEETIAVLEKLK